MTYQTKAKQNLVLIFWRNRQGFLLSAHASTPPLPGYSISENSFVQQLCFFIGKIFTFLKKKLCKHVNFKYLNYFHTFLGLQKAKFDS